jgi:Zn-dependent peptidase ImmA (M78 family)
VGDSYSAWIEGTKQPTLKQLAGFAKKFMVPLGCLFLETPPKESLAIADFRTLDGATPRNPSPNLLDTFYTMQSRQRWMREELVESGASPMPIVGSISSKDSVQDAVQTILRHLQLEERWHKLATNEAKRCSLLRRAADQIGILVFFSGIVGHNTRRTLDTDEFRGFVLVDEYAPLIFVNSNDSETARLFTLTHEIVHLALGESGLFNFRRFGVGNEKLEVRCNAIAAELLVPRSVFVEQWKKTNTNQIPKLARHFGVSRAVIARRAFDLGYITQETFVNYYHALHDEWLKQKSKNKEKKGESKIFYPVAEFRRSRCFSEAVVIAADSGRLLLRDAYRLLDLRGNTFETFANKLKEVHDG